MNVYIVIHTVYELTHILLLKNEYSSTMVVTLSELALIRFLRIACVNDNSFLHDAFFCLRFFEL